MTVLVLLPCGGQSLSFGIYVRNTPHRVPPRVGKLTREETAGLPSNAIGAVAGQAQGPFFRTEYPRSQLHVIIKVNVDRHISFVS